MFIIPSINSSMKLSLLKDSVSKVIVTMVISNKSCCKHIRFMNLSDFIFTTTRVTSVNYKKFLLGSFSVAKFGIAPKMFHVLMFLVGSRNKSRFQMSHCLTAMSAQDTLKHSVNVNHFLIFV